MWLKKKDNVLVLSGKDKGKKGEILKKTGDSKFLVAKINMVKKHQRSTGQEVGGIIQKELPVNQSKLALICPQCDSPTRVKISFLDNGEKSRVCRKCSARIE
ncbi:MAG: 50S ribosomal protein L24 [Elusimicrobia bacterium RIFCSPLOWO2_02_FULL_39_32]|nr:MAG: 50S ribosomal protein L24 [Elusimicrobia bacterium GWA2_38_7]OGR80859.1 MAG: 50S ribosomal protein L24 [Elusimicrobia bacterium RIFCSPHIGHO2_02_FULL_39_36]OGR93738.1 MAG: 50S ribosomal protein L24 [Elusimicrobia bacterium RIFCSPLOWO2_02_FULL_39_32]OGS00953.1 MAG: 50S ribosomal protein L24 [Elusimicrobia bacterium RIFCSPLOWO2_12_FULL_39_28]